MAAIPEGNLGNDTDPDEVSGGVATTAPSESSIKLRGLVKSFGGQVFALKGIDLDISSGEFFTLLGPSGCGKTTLLRILAGLEKASDGSVEIGGKPVTNTPPHKRNVNTVFQSYALFSHLSVRDNIGFGLRMRGVKKDEIHKRVEETASFIKIGELLDRRLTQLSGGQQQRIALARALINEPDVLLLDEPLSALDAGLRSDLQIELMRIQRRLGMTFIFVTHDQQEAMVMSDRIAVLNDGKIQQVGPPRELYEMPENLFVAQFMGHSNLFPIRERTDTGVETDLGWLTGSFDSGTHLLIRPEIVTLSTEPANGESNKLSATVKECIYRGSVAEYRLNCGQAELMVKSNNRGQAMFDVGDTVTAEIEVGGAVTIHE